MKYSNHEDPGYPNDFNDKRCVKPLGVNLNKDSEMLLTP